MPIPHCRLPHARIISPVNLICTLVANKSLECAVSRKLATACAQRSCLCSETGPLECKGQRRTTSAQCFQSIGVLLLNLKVGIEEVQPLGEVWGSSFCWARTKAFR